MMFMPYQPTTSLDFLHFKQKDKSEIVSKLNRKCVSTVNLVFATQIKPTAKLPLMLHLCALVPICCPHHLYRLHYLARKHHHHQQDHTIRRDYSQNSRNKEVRPGVRMGADHQLSINTNPNTTESLCLWSFVVYRCSTCH